MKHVGVGRLWRRPSLWTLLAGLVLASAVSVTALVSSGFELSQVAVVHSAAAEHIDQDELLDLVRAGQRHEAFEMAFEEGDELFETQFNALDGGGANVGGGQRYTRMPRADRKGPGEWFNHTPERVTGPNAAACNECHEAPFDDGAGTANSNVHRDPFRTGSVSLTIQRNTPHVFAPGAVQRLAEEMTTELHRRRQLLADVACARGGTWRIALAAKGVSFGSLDASRIRTSPCRLRFNTDRVEGIDFQGSVDNPDADPDLIVRPFQWKGSVGFIRDFNRGASHNELGMQAVEITGDNVDGDGDGVRNEFTIGDQTGLAIYLAAQPRPTTLVEMNSLGLLDPALTSEQIAQINRGEQVFSAVGCDSCHVPRLTIDDPVFSEPSQHAAYRDGDAFPAGQNPAARGVDPRFPITFDLTRDQPDNHIPLPGGGEFNLGAFRRDGAGRAIVELYSDLKRHFMGPRLAESVNEIAGDDVTPIPLNPRNRHTPETFLTETLWGVGSTAPYMHDGRATTLTEAILEHATGASNDPSEAREERAAYLSRSSSDKQALVAFLENLVLFKLEEEAAATGIASLTGETKQLKVTIAPKGFKIKLP